MLSFLSQGLKTGMYYLRTRAAADAIKFTVDQSALKKKSANPVAASISAAAATLPDGTPVTAVKTAGSAMSAFASNMEREAELAKMVCSLQNKDECLMCGS